MSEEDSKPEPAETRRRLSPNDLSLGSALNDESLAPELASAAVLVEDVKAPQPYPPPQPTEADAPAEPAPPPRATIDNTPDIDPLSQEVSVNSGLYRKYPPGPAKPTP
jgi:hypothetical protein